MAAALAAPLEKGAVRTVQAALLSETPKRFMHLGEAALMQCMDRRPNRLFKPAVFGSNAVARPGRMLPRSNVGVAARQQPLR
jgi:hypothetical protein